MVARRNSKRFNTITWHASSEHIVQCLGALSTIRSLVREVLVPSDP
jgi:hypothetical protein